MKLKTLTEYREQPVTTTIDGKSHTRMKKVPVQVPKLPRDWDQVAVRAATTVVMLLTAVAVAWSTYSIGALLHGGMGYFAASVFDAAWIVNVLLEYLGRFDAKKRQRNKWLGWGLLLATMGAIFWEGMLSGSVALGVVGAAVSLFAKVLWLSIMTFINKDLSEDHQEWVAQETSEANAKMALAQVRRQSARAEAYAALELLAAERIRNQYAALTPAPAAEPFPVLDADVQDDAAARDELTLRRAVRAVLDDATGQIPQEEATLAIEAAHEDGWTTNEIYSRAMDIRKRERDAVTSRRREATDAGPDAPGRGADIRPDVVSAQASSPDTGEAIRPDIRKEEAEPRPSLAAEVSRLVKRGRTDADHIIRALADRFDRKPDDPVFGETVRRYVRAAKQPVTNKTEHPGFYP
ncbi:hypothetical protein [Streptomyces sp. BRA346]|uniref:hypothetical protein n=1 Tax=Streptomyces sp. BRA346 TaxID=2878199 RepID=UPI004063AC83